MSQIQVDLDQVRYEFMVRIAERIVEAGGTIFGGFLRDKLIRDHYSKMKAAEVEKTKVAEIEKTEKVEKTIPQNLNLVFDGDADELQRFYQGITRDDVDFTSEIDNRPHPFLQQGFRHSVELTMKNAEQIVGKPISLHLDLFCSPRPVDFLAGDQDLQCNQLICDTEGIRASADPAVDGSVFRKFSHEQELIARILARTTRVVPSPEGTLRCRLQSAVKMMLRGWTVENINSFRVVEPCVGLCLFCQDQIQGRSIELNCCMRPAHSDCFLRFLEEPDRCFFSKTSCRHQICLEILQPRDDMPA